MAKVKCAICRKETDSGYNGVKYCPDCEMWFCFQHAGPGVKQCPHCKKQTLK